MSTNDQLAALREIVSSKMGRCILGLQQYERQMKRVLAVREVSGHPEALAEQAFNRQSALAKNTLGQLVSEFGNNFIKPESSTKADAEIANDAALDRSELHI